MVTWEVTKDRENGIQIEFAHERERDFRTYSTR
jgi:hypothetical protein